MVRSTREHGRLSRTATGHRLHDGQGPHRGARLHLRVSDGHLRGVLCDRLLGVLGDDVGDGVTALDDVAIGSDSAEGRGSVVVVGVEVIVY